MGTMFVKIKILPKSTETDKELLKKKIKEVIESKKGTVKEYSLEPIAFGLVALIVLFEIDESEDTELIEEALENLEDVSSIQTLDIRRAIG